MAKKAAREYDFVVEFQASRGRILHWTLLLLIGAPLAVAAPTGAATPLRRGRLLAHAYSPTLTLQARGRRLSKGYRLSVTVTQDPTRRPSTFLTVELTKTLGPARQWHDYNVQLRLFDCTLELTGCTIIRTGHRLGAYGQLSLTFVPRGRLIALPVDPHCTGQESERRGSLVGKFHFSPHNAGLPSYDGNLRLTIGRLTSKDIYQCNLPGYPSCHKVYFAGFDRDLNGPQFSFAQPDNGKPTTGGLWFGRQGYNSPGTWVDHFLYYRLPATALSIAPDLSSATLDAGSLPFLTGSLHYATDVGPTPRSDHCGTGVAAGGQVTGDLTAHFDGLPPRPFAPMQASVWREP
jgi:hypothetical protein